MGSACSDGRMWWAGGGGGAFTGVKDDMLLSVKKDRLVHLQVRETSREEMHVIDDWVVVLDLS